jgi:hypothetical protein
MLFYSIFRMLLYYWPVFVHDRDSVLQTSLETDPISPFLAMVGRYIRPRLVDESHLLM